MCGIIGYVGKRKNALPVLLDGLKALEYRGYDSAGVAFIKEDGLNIIKSVGPISSLEAKLDLNVDSNIGIGHTRWATHGIANEINSHPHNVGKIILVHNGIIENYSELKEELINDGVNFNSDTDSEVAAALINELYNSNKDMIKTIVEFQKMVKGSYALVIIVNDVKDKLYVVKNMSPLIIGLGDKENFIASDVPAILNRTDKYINLLDGEFAEITNEKILVFDKTGNKKEYMVNKFTGDATETSKGEYEHFMLKEINEEPEVVRGLLTKYIINNEIVNLPDLKSFKSITIVACGSAMHAGLIGKYVIEQNCLIPVQVEIASEFKYKKLFLGKGDAVIAISQSGETADTLSAVKIANNLGCHTIGIVNVKESSIAREVQDVVYTLAGSEIAVATTKAYLAQSVILFLMGYKNKISNKCKDALVNVPQIIRELIAKDSDYKRIAQMIKNREDIFFIGRQIDYAMCMEGSLKLKEISYIHSEAYAAGELKHGTISLISDGTPVFAIITDKNVAEKTISNIKEVKVRGAKVILLISEELSDVSADVYDEKIVIPSVGDEFDAIISVIPLQLIAYYSAKLRNCSIDKPRNLAKSVTVE